MFTHHHFVGKCVVVLILFVPGAFAQSETQKSSVASTSKSAGPSSVSVESVTKVFIAKDSPAYLISYRYDFDKLRTVYIKGLGSVPAKGRYLYLSKEQELEFRDPESNAVLARVPLQETAIVAAKPPLTELASESQFPPGHRAFIWDLPTALQEQANAVLGRYFNYLPRESNKLTYLATTYTPLQLDRKLSERGVLAQLALLLSFPYDPSTGKYSFHVQTLPKEGRALSDDFRPTNNVDILKAAEGFVDKLVAEMKAGGQVKQ